MDESAELGRELQPQRKPEFDGGSFTIEYLSSSPQGFEVKTNKSEKRKSDKPLPFNQEQKKQLKEAIPSQIRYAKGDTARANSDIICNKFPHRHICTDPISE